ncbi:MAG TPA: hypothetical protein VKN99_10235 [Polyangia bacterium]|nr:hypothetical protein [Polyangia bacterium]
MTEPDPLNPYAPPQTDVEAPPSAGRAGGFLAQRLGADLVVEKNAPLPPICVKCARRDDLTRRAKTFIWTPPWVYILIFVNLLVLIIVALIVRKRGALALPLCRLCNARWRNGQIWAGLSVLGLIALIVGGIVLGAGLKEPWLMAAGLFAGVMAAVFINILVVRPRLLRAKKVDDRLITLTGLHPDAVSAIVEAARGAPASVPAPAV